MSLTVVTYAFARSSLLEQRDELARTQAVSNALRVREHLRSGDSPGDWFPNLRVESGGFAAAVLSTEEPVATDNLYSYESFPIELRQAVERGVSGVQRFEIGDEHYVGVGVNIAEVDANYYEAFRLGPTEDTLRTILFTLVVGSLVTILLASFAGWWTSGRLLRPLGRITDAAGEIAAGDLDTRVVREGDPDLDRLADSFNDMADAVQARIEREARFASDVSHELRSPITALAAAAEVIDGRRGELPDRTQQALDVVVGQVRRFDAMVIDLLELSRIDAGATDLNTEQVEIETLCRRVAARNGFADLPIDVTKPAGMNGAPLTAMVDRLRFERILANLLENAVHHGGGPHAAVTTTSASRRRRRAPTAASPTRPVGSRTTKRAPPPWRSSTHASPPCAVACSATRARPSPVPMRWRAALPRAKRSKMRARSPRATPGPASSTATSRNGPSVGSIEMRVGPPPWCSAFSSRLVRIRSKRIRSTTAVIGGAVHAGRLGDVDRQVGEPVPGGDAPAQRLDLDLLGVQVGGPGVDARQLEEVDDHGVEPPHLADDDVERLLGAVGQLAAAAVDDLGGGGQRGDRRAQLVADVGGEAGLPLDAGLHGVGHVVERVGEPVEVGVALAHDARVEVAGGDLAGGVGDPPERAQQPPARPPPDEARQQDRDERADDEREQDRAQRVLGRVRAGTPRSSWRRPRRCGRRRRRTARRRT